MTNHSQLVEAANHLVNELTKFMAEIHTLEASPEGERGDVAAGWQPIESAPKDESWVLIWVQEAHSEGVAYAAWYEGESDELPWWRTYDGIPVEGQPTHWMPLPNPPAAQPDEPKELTDSTHLLIDNCMNQYAVPEGHVAVYLPVEDVAGIAHTGFKEDCPDSEDLERFGTLYKACRQALSNGEGV